MSLAQDASAHDVLSVVVERRIMPCPVCAAPFESRQSLKDHVNALHLHKKCVRCADCGESFTWRSQLWKHRRTPGQCRSAGTEPFEFA